MRKGLSILLVLSSASVAAFAEDQGSLAPVSAIVQSSTLKDRIGMAGAGLSVAGAVTAGSAFKIKPAPISADLQTPASQAALLEKKIRNLIAVDTEYRNAYRRSSISALIDDSLTVELRNWGDRRSRIYKDLQNLDDVPELKKTPGLAEALKKYSDLSEELMEQQKSWLSYLGAESRARVSRDYHPRGRSETEILKELNAHTEKLRKVYTQPSLNAAKAAEAKAASLARSAIVKRAKIAGVVGGTGLGVVLGAGMIAGALESDRAVTAIDPGQDTGMYNELNRFSEAASEGSATPAGTAESRH